MSKEKIMSQTQEITSAGGNPVKVSFEYFPPKTAEMEATLWATITKLAPLNPAFVSVTYGAGGTTRERTHATVRRLRQETALQPAAHLTCVGATREEIDAVARDYWDAGIRHIVALRGDMPGGAAYQPHPGGYAYAADLVEGLKKIGDFEISVAAYPEAHPQAGSLAAEIEFLKRKVDAGATRAITQYFFDVDLFERYLDLVAKAGIRVPIVPGIMPVTNISQLLKFSAACGTSVPQWLVETFDGLDADPETRKLVAASVAVEQVQKLRAIGIEDFHFYTLNRAELTMAICRRLGIRPLSVTEAA
jgi:methylenetetrahydrofolate reductase (NADPH)